MKKRMMTLALLGLLTGCSTAPTALHYYSLDAEIPQSNSVTAQPRHQLVLRPVALSGQLDRMSLSISWKARNCTLPSIIVGRARWMRS